MGKLNMDAMQARLDAAENGNYQNADYDKLQNGKNVRRILWPKGDRDSFYSEGFLHFSLGSDGKQVVTCPKTFDSKNRCPVCEYVEQLQKSKNKDDKKLANDIKMKKRIYVNVLNRDSEEDADTPKVLPIGVQILKGLLEAICDPDYGDITDPENGTDVTITRKGQGLNTEYSVLPKKKESVVSETSSPEEIEEAMADLDALFIERSYEELEAVLNGESLNDDDEEGGNDDDPSYDEMELDELQELCKERGLRITGKVTRIKCISLLTKYDEAAEETDDEENAEEDEPAEDDKSGEDEGGDDEVGDAIAAALARRNKGKGKGSKK